MALRLMVAMGWPFALFSMRASNPTRLPLTTSSMSEPSIVAMSVSCTACQPGYVTPDDVTPGYVPPPRNTHGAATSS